jgi:hypothetical protein
MPYAPGIQDISGQLIGEGMTRASNIRAQARSDFSKTIADTLVGGIQQYQQNQNFNKQSLAKFTGMMQDPDFKQYVNSVLADENNTMGVPESVRTSLTNAQIGKLKSNDSAVLATIAQDFSEKKRANQDQEYKKAQTMLAYAQVFGLIAKANAPKPGQIMTQEEFLKLDPALEARGKPIGDGSGRILVESMSNRAPIKSEVDAVNIGGDTVLLNKTTGEEVRRFPNTSPMPAGFEQVPRGPAVAPAVSAVAAPASLGQFMQSQSMAPSQMGLLASQGGAGMQPSAAPSPTAIAAINAVQAAQGVAPTIARAPAAIAPASVGGVQPMAIRPIAGSPAAIEAQQKAQGETKARETLQGNIDTTMNTIKSIEKKASKYSVGAPGVTNIARAAGKFFNMADSVDVEGLLKTLEGNIAFDALRNLKDSGTSLGQIAIKELDLLKSSRGSLEQSLSYPLFMENLNRFKIQTEYAGKKLKVLNSALEKGLTEPTKDFYELDKKQSDALKALEKTPEQRLKDMGFTIKSRS